MCSREEVQAISDRAEKRMEDRLLFSHNSLAKNISNFMGEFKQDLNDIKEKVDDVGDRLAGRVAPLETWREVHVTEHGTLNEKVDGILSLLKWVGMLVGGAFIVAIINLVIKQ